MKGVSDGVGGLILVRVWKKLAKLSLFWRSRLKVVWVSVLLFLC